tara:strand:- start:135 stop:374 length:240 start_codon:yes stop_codon:yes gene_type:complete
MKKEIDIEEIFCPNCNKLKKEKDGYSSAIMDAELDVIQCKFYNDDCVVLNTEELTYITLTSQNLRNLLDLIEEVEEWEE